ncbi:unnamed protein product [Parajaminaea phylloscopi]
MRARRGEPARTFELKVERERSLAGPFVPPTKRYNPSCLPNRFGSTTSFDPNHLTTATPIIRKAYPPAHSLHGTFLPVAALRSAVLDAMSHLESLATISDSRKVVLISGCSTGIGRALALEFAAYRGGRTFHVFATARKIDAIRDLPSSIERVSLDVTDDESTRACVRSVIDQVGHIDILVNNAGINTGVGPSVEVDLDRFRQTFDANFFGLIRLTQAVAPHMMDRRQGSIINIGSTVGLVPLPYGAAYAASKAAVHSFSETLQMELKGFGISVTVVAPGAIKSSIGDSGAGHIKVADNSRYTNVQDMVQYRAVYSQVGRPSPTPTAVFANQVVSECADPRRRPWFLSWIFGPRQPPRYLVAGSRSSIIKILFYLPVWLRQLFIGRLFQISRIGKGSRKAA